MQKKGSEIIYSPSDLITFMNEKFSSYMDRMYLELPEKFKPDEIDESMALIQKQGISHEEEFLAQLKAHGNSVCVIENKSENKLSETVEALKSGADVIYQAYLRKDSFAGLSDFLIKKKGDSLLGDFHYEVWDSKLAKKAKPYFLVQLCAYAEMLEQIQGRLPQNIAVVLGNKEIKEFRLLDFYYFYLALKKRFLRFQEQFSVSQEPPFIEAGSYSRWKDVAGKILEERDDLIRVANISKVQVKKLKAEGIDTLTSLAKSERTAVRGIATNTLARLKAQARLQLASQDKYIPEFEIIKNENENEARGLELLPPGSLMDVYFDMEGYPLIDGGLEYLFGASTIARGSFIFDDWWAHNASEEKFAFESFMDWLAERWHEDKQMHVYHYGIYEIAALRRLASRYATKENLLDEFLRNELFIDLYKIVRQGLRIGSRSYSIKDVERLYMDKREQDVARATDSIVYYQRWLENKDGKDFKDSTLLNEIRKYNQVDCESTALLHRFLLTQQKQSDIKYLNRRVIKTDQYKNKAVSENEKLASKLLSELSIDPEPGDKNRQLKELLAYLLCFHSRERKVSWWEFFDRLSLSEDELFHDPECIASASRVPTEALPYKKSSLSFLYSFDPDQDLKLKDGDTVAFSTNSAIKSEIISIDPDNGYIKLKASQKKEALPQSGDLVLIDTVRNDVLEKSIYDQTKSYLNGEGLKPCISELLFKNYPRLKHKSSGEIICEKSDPGLVDIIAAVENLDQSYLCIQGPPGTGKSYLAARAIIDLIRKGKKIAVSSNSHKAIENLLEEIAAASIECGLEFAGAKVKQDQSGEVPRFSGSNIKHYKDDKKVIGILDGLQLVGGTAWFFAREELKNKFDYLFVDEAGQVCLANLIAMGQAADNLVLIGDHLQLEQPVKGAHPGQSGLSCLDYLLTGSGTIDPRQGIFLSLTRRMHPELCQLVSSAVYESRLHSAARTAQRKLLLSESSKSLITKTAGLVYIAAEHEGNSQSSVEEVQLIEKLVAELSSCKIKDHALERDLILKDIIVVTPYNQQVRLIRSQIPGIQAGSVDKFQGSEAAVVILSMCASKLENSARGLEFLLSKKRLNVAISRAQILAIVVGSPSLSEFDCSSVEQASLLNLYCRLMQEEDLRSEKTCIFSS